MPVVGPVRVDRSKEQFAEAGHEGDLPEDRLQPWTCCFNSNSSEVWILGVGKECDFNLFRFEAVGL